MAPFTIESPQTFKPYWIQMGAEMIGITYDDMQRLHEQYTPLIAERVTRNLFLGAYRCKAKTLANFVTRLKAEHARDRRSLRIAKRAQRV